MPVTSRTCRIFGMAISRARSVPRSRMRTISPGLAPCRRRSPRSAPSCWMRLHAFEGCCLNIPEGSTMSTHRDRSRRLHSSRTRTRSLSIGDAAVTPLAAPENGRVPQPRPGQPFDVLTGDNQERFSIDLLEWPQPEATDSEPLLRLGRQRLDPDLPFTARVLIFPGRWIAPFSVERILIESTTHGTAVRRGRPLLAQRTAAPGGS